ncbi:MAG: vitamin K epoxide reductase family protein [Microgenomates group bacterium]
MPTNIITLIVLSALGIANAHYLHFQYLRYLKTGKKMYCLMGEDCASVVGSKYGKSFGVKNELIGITYYLMLMGYAILGQYITFTSPIILLVEIATIVATLFSFYLLILQAFVLKSFCSWCLIAILLNILIFFVVMGPIL